MTAEEDVFKILLKELCKIAYAVGYKQGFEEGYHQAIQKPIRNLIKGSSFSDEQIAAFMEVTVNYVSNIRKTVDQES